jgi:peptide/nickel transport system permease protein
MINLEKTKKKGNSQFAIAVRQFKRNKLAVVGLAIFTIIVLACIFQHWLTPYDYAKQDLKNRFADISWKHICGTDQYGRDLFTRILKGGQISLLVALLAVLFAAAVSIVLGTSAAFFGGALEIIIMRLVDIFMSIPALLLAAGVSTALGPGISKSVFAIGLSQVANMTRTMYSSALTIRGQEYLEAARACGASKTRIIFKYMLPNCLAPIIVLTTLRFGICITQIASLSFFGLGVQPPTPEWGSILNQGKLYIRQYWPLVTFPGLAIALTLISFNLVGDGIRDALDPRLKR